MTRLCIHVRVVLVAINVNIIVNVLNVFNPMTIFTQKYDQNFSSHHDNHVQDDGGRVDEQIDKNTGAQVSAQALTWSYANVRNIYSLILLLHLTTIYVFIIIFNMTIDSNS